MLLVGDIGGTKTDLAIFPLSGDMEPETQATFKSADHPSLEDIVEKFLANRKLTVTKAVFGVAGPVVNGKSQITNLPWHISETTLKDAFNLSAVKLLNDLEAIGYAVPHLPPHNLEKLNGNPIDTTLGKHKAIIAPGTGLGEAGAAPGQSRAESGIRQERTAVVPRYCAVPPLCCGLRR